MDPDVPLVVSQVNPDDLDWHEGIIANPNCSTMQLDAAADGAARRGRPRAGDRGHLPVRRAAPATRRSSSSRSRSGPTPRAAPKVATVYPHPIAFNALPQIDVVPGQRLHEGGVEGRHREPQDPAPAGPARLVHGRPRAGVRQPLRGGPRRDARPDHARPRPASCSRPSPGVVVQDDPADEPLPAGDRGRRVATRCSSAASARTRRSPDNRGLAFWVVSDNLRKGAASNAVEIAEVLVERGWIRKASERQPVGGGRGTTRVTRDERRAALEAIAERGPGLHALPAPRGADEGRPGRGRPRHRGRVRRRGPRLQRGPRGPAVRRPRRRPAGPAPRLASAGGARTCSSPTS